ncbi:hypothetical protein PMIN05_012623 [Paraphaeosphaeria minitans]
MFGCFARLLLGQDCAIDRFDSACNSRALSRSRLASERVERARRQAPRAKTFCVWEPASLVTPVVGPVLMPTLSPCPSPGVRREFRHCDMLSVSVVLGLRHAVLQTPPCQHCSTADRSWQRRSWRSGGARGSWPNATGGRRVDFVIADLAARYRKAHVELQAVFLSSVDSQPLQLRTAFV